MANTMDGIKITDAVIKGNDSIVSFSGIDGFLLTSIRVKVIHDNLDTQNY